MLVSVLGTLAAIASLTIIVWGLPKQIYLNYKRKSCEGLAPDLVYSAFVIYLFWGIYGWAKPDWFIFVADIPGAILSAILVYQLYHYGDRQKRAEFWQKQFAWLKPDYILGSLLQLDISTLFRYSGRVYLVLDLDNTICLPGSEEVDPRVVEMIMTAMNRDMVAGVVILSNTIFPSKKREARVARVARLLGAEHVCAIRPHHKPHPKALLTAMDKLPGALPRNTIMVGDQLFTDIRLARRVGVRSVLVKPLGRDAAYITWKRWLETIIFRLTQWR